MPLPITCKICPVSSVSDFIKQIEELRSSFCLFRGEADFYEHNFMRAKALRSYSNTCDNPRPVDPFFLKMKDFGRYVKHRLTENEQNNFLAFSQHYGIPTNLLDVTTSPLVALYFACQPRGCKSTNGWRSKYFIGHKSRCDFGFVYVFRDYVDITSFIEDASGQPFNLLEIIFLNNSKEYQEILPVFQVLKDRNPEYFAALLDEAKNCYVSELYYEPDCEDGFLEVLFDADPLSAYWGLVRKDESLEFVNIENVDPDVQLYVALAAFILRQIKLLKVPMWNIDFLPNFLYRPNLNFERIQNQKGLFLYQMFYTYPDSLSDVPISPIQRLKMEPILFEIHNKKKILHTLDMLGFNEMTIMSDYDSIAHYINNQDKNHVERHKRKGS